MQSPAWWPQTREARDDRFRSGTSLLPTSVRPWFLHLNKIRGVSWGCGSGEKHSGPSRSDPGWANGLSPGRRCLAPRRKTGLCRRGWFPPDPSLSSRDGTGLCVGPCDHAVPVDTRLWASALAACFPPMSIGLSHVLSRSLALWHCFGEAPSHQPMQKAPHFLHLAPARLLRPLMFAGLGGGDYGKPV